MGVCGEDEGLCREPIDLSPQQQGVLPSRTAPRPSGTIAPLPSGDAQDRAGVNSAPLSFVASRDDLWHLMTELRREDRDYPIIVLTLGDGGEEGFPPDAIRALDPRVPIYLLGNSRLCQRLTDTLGPQLAAEGGDARIFWADIGENSDAADHPLVPIHSVSDHRDPAERLVSAFDLSRPHVRQYLAPIQKRLAAFEAQAAPSSVELRESHAERDAALERAQAAESRLTELEQQLQALNASRDMTELEAVAGMGCEE
jgi:hypothetical protein